MFADLPSSIEYVRVGNLRALAVSTASRSDALPDIPPLADFLPSYEASGWFGIGAPKNTPAEFVERLIGYIRDFIEFDRAEICGVFPYRKKTINVSYPIQTRPADRLRLTNAGRFPRTRRARGPPADCPRWSGVLPSDVSVSVKSPALRGFFL